MAVVEAQGIRNYWPAGILEGLYMTKVQVRFRLPKPMDEVLLARIADAHALYGIQRVQVTPTLDGLTVEYDASRLRPAEVESALTGAGIAVERVS